MNWISVKDRLSEEEVLLYCKQRGKIRIFTGSDPQVMNGNRVYFHTYAGWRRATHWMPLPEPPKEDE